MNFDYGKLRVKEGEKVRLKDYHTCEDGGFTKKPQRKSLSRTSKS